MGEPLELVQQTYSTTSEPDAVVAQEQWLREHIRDMDAAYDPAGWRDFGVALTSASAALLGLVFVVVSIQLRAVAGDPVLRRRAEIMLGLLATTLAASAALVVPGQSRKAPRRRIEEFGGRLVKTTGDGVLATFDGPGRGILCAQSLRRDLEAIGAPIRSGLHAGEVELRGDDIGGVAVHIAARVMAAACPGEVLVSRTVRDLVVGSDLKFDDRGPHELKGVESSWELFALAG